MSFLTDTFTDVSGTVLSSHTPDLGGGAWAAHAAAPSNLQISNANRCRANGTTNCIWYNPTAPSTPNYSVEADLVFIGAGPVQVYGVMGRIDSAATTFYYFHYNGSTGDWELYKTVASVDTLLGSFSDVGNANNDKHAKLIMDGSNISGAVGGVVVVGPIVDTDITAAGYAGLISLTSSGTVDDTHGSHFDNFDAVALAGRAAYPSGNLASKRRAGFAVSSPGGFF